jgi:hypothetical protein
VLFFTVRNFLVHLRECFFVFSFYPENWKLKLVQAQAYSLKKRASSLLWKKATKVFSFKGSAHRKNWWTHIQTLDAEAETTGMTLASAYPPAGTGLVKHSELQTLSQGVIPQVNDEPLVSVLVPEALSWSSLHGLVVGDNSHERSGTIPGVGLVHAPLTLLPSPFPRQAFSQAIELAPLFNRLIDRVSQDADFLQQALARYHLHLMRLSWIFVQRFF